MGFNYLMFMKCNRQKVIFKKLIEGRPNNGFSKKFTIHSREKERKPAESAGRRKKNFIIVKTFDIKCF